MGKQYFTVGIAGHIDHGKTALTKALTGVDTDRLKEEKERNISIELGFAPLFDEENLKVSIVDVPGHERFIRQMIAGVSGIDLMLLVVAADEGVMPQTKEHLEILTLLGVQRGIVVITKIDRVEEELLALVEEEIQEELINTVFAHAPVLFIDSLNKVGIERLKDEIRAYLEDQASRDIRGSFRMPIDQVFTVKGHGTVVRGTVSEGKVHEGAELFLLPKRMPVRIRQIQVHNTSCEEAVAGQRAAFNLAGVSKEEIERGDVLVSDQNSMVTTTLDVSLQFVKLHHPIKQRSIVKCHIGTAEVMGKLVFFDRNEVTDNQEEVLCQLRLNEPVHAKRGDRFILRRPSPQETIGGGLVIDAHGSTYKFGQSTIELLQQKQQGNPGERVADLLHKHYLMSREEIMRHISLTEQEWDGLFLSSSLLVVGSSFTLRDIANRIGNEIMSHVKDYHLSYSLRPGIKKAELLEVLSYYPRKLMEYVLEEACKQRMIEIKGQYVTDFLFVPHFPPKWEKRMEHIVNAIKEDGIMGKEWSHYVQAAALPASEAEDLYYYLLSSRQLYCFGQQVISAETVSQLVKQLKENTASSFSIQEAKDILNVSRKLLVLVLELMDRLGYTMRVDNKREWRELDETICKASSSCS